MQIKSPKSKEIDNILGFCHRLGHEGGCPNFCPQKEFFEYLSVKKFTATC